LQDAVALRHVGADELGVALLQRMDPRWQRRLSHEVLLVGLCGYPANGLCQSACPTKNGPSVWRYCEVCVVFRMACTRCESGWRWRPTRPMTKSLSLTSRPWHASRTSWARSASPQARPSTLCSRMMAPCSCGVSLLNEPVRRSGYQIPHG